MIIIGKKMFIYNHMIKGTKPNWRKMNFFSPAYNLKDKKRKKYIRVRWAYVSRNLSRQVKTKQITPTEEFSDLMRKKFASLPFET